MDWRVTVDRNRVLLAALGLHLAVAVVHGATHGLVPVYLSPWQNLVVLVTTFLGPIVGVVLALRTNPLGLPTFTVSMAGALLIGGVLHFFLENPDHVHAIPAGPWQVPFRASATAVFVTTLVGTTLGAWYWYTRERGSFRTLPVRSGR